MVALESYTRPVRSGREFLSHLRSHRLGKGHTILGVVFEKPSDPQNALKISKREGNISTGSSPLHKVRLMPDPTTLIPDTASVIGQTADPNHFDGRQSDQDRRTRPNRNGETIGQRLLSQMSQTYDIYGRLSKIQAQLFGKKSAIESGNVTIFDGEQEVIISWITLFENFWVGKTKKVDTVALIVQAVHTQDGRTGIQIRHTILRGQGSLCDVNAAVAFAQYDYSHQEGELTINVERDGSNQGDVRGAIRDSLQRLTHKDISTARIDWDDEQIDETSDADLVAYMHNSSESILNKRLGSGNAQSEEDQIITENLSQPQMQKSRSVIRGVFRLMRKNMLNIFDIVKRPIRTFKEMKRIEAYARSQQPLFKQDKDPIEIRAKGMKRNRISGGLVFDTDNVHRLNQLEPQVSIV